MTRLEEVRHVLAIAMVSAVMDGLPASSPQTNERMAEAICEWMSSLTVIYSSGVIPGSGEREDVT